MSYTTFFSRLFLYLYTFQLGRAKKLMADFPEHIIAAIEASTEHEDDNSSSLFGKSDDQLAEILVNDFTTIYAVAYTVEHLRDLEGAKRQSCLRFLSYIARDDLLEYVQYRGWPTPPTFKHERELLRYILQLA